MTGALGTIVHVHVFVDWERDYPDPFLFFSDGIGTPNILFDRGPSGFLGIVYTPLKTNMEHNHGGLSKWVICRFHVNLPGCNSPTAKHLK